ncbi:MAG: DUF362 domain-containing protein [Candidatus Omnitrophica bacterium]|nr:DUF362 domain-containing protein [Candidatus Omnitrophota bacterium]
MTCSSITRRRFVQTIPAVAGALSLTSAAAQKKSLVVEVHRPGITQENNRPDPAGVQEMLDRAMQEFTGEKSRKDQWARCVSKDDVVGLKVNGLGGPRLSTKTELIYAIIKRLVEFGVKENNIIVWDDRIRCMQAVGMDVNFGDAGVRVYTTDNPKIGWEEKETHFGSASANISKIMAQQITALINLPIMKDHRYSGVTLSLKNISHGITNRSGRFHGNNCCPYIAEINAAPVVKKKYRLTILDAFQGCYDKGPMYAPSGLINYDSLYIAADRSALDTIGAARIEKARKENGLLPVAEVGRPAKFIAEAAELGVGTNNLEQIEHRVIEA